LAALLPKGISKIFYSDNGATAVEAALKIAIQYWYNQNPATKRRKVICFKHGYHGDTFGAMSVSERTLFNRPFWTHLFETVSIDPPFLGQEERSYEQLKELIRHGDIACFIFEPLLLGMGGMHIYPVAGLDALCELCSAYDVVTIADECLTGFGRTGSIFASELLQHAPDIICFSKGLTGGFMTLGATACKEYLFNAFLSDELSAAFLHGHSYSGNPLACSSALASLDLLEKEECKRQRDLIAESHKNFCLKWSYHPHLKRCKSLGTILVLEYDSKERSSYLNPLRDQLYYFFLNHGILLRPLGNVICLSPPYCIAAEELETIYQHIILTLDIV
jgi:adenosylmethionine-8-amino-7-oxononanoate aminotransferase